jgi:hypothetical protein
LTQLEEAAAKNGPEGKAAAVLSLLRGLVDYVSRTRPINSRTSSNKSAARQAPSRPR